MSDRVIRFGGSNIGNLNSVNHLKQFLSRSSGKKLVVVSSIPDLLSWIEERVSMVFQDKNTPENLNEYLYSLFTEKTGMQTNLEFKTLVEQLVSLLKGIALIGDYSKALRDQVLSFSERLSVVILATQWNKDTPTANILLPGEIELTANAEFGNATFLTVNKSYFENLPDGIYMVPGSFGITEKGKVARTGKTAADYTAAFLTASLGIEKLELWGLDSFFQKADSKIVENPPLIHRLTYSEASELAYFDHYSFHPRTVEPLEMTHIPIHVLNTSDAEGKVDTIINTEAYVDEKIVKSVACSDDISFLKLDGPGVGLKPGILAKITTRLNDAGINIKSVITSQISINIILEKNTGEKALRIVEKLGFNTVKEIHLIKDVSLVGIIGHGMQQNYGVSARIFTAVAQHHINVLLSGSGASDLVSYLVVKSADKEKSVKVIYKAFFD
jgi:aspartate kinase/aspartokinase/homoserine dehydrogenase 1